MSKATKRTATLRGADSGRAPETDSAARAASAALRDRINDALLVADREVILRHRRGSVPLVLWRDGKVVEVDPFKVRLPRIPKGWKPGVWK